MHPRPILALLTTLLLASAPAAAADRVLGQPRLLDNGDLTLGDGLRLGRIQGGRLDISGSSVAPDGGELRTLAAALSDEINVRSLRAGVCTGSEAIDTAALNIALSRATLSNGGTIRLPACDQPYRLLVPSVANDPTGIIGFRIPSNTIVRGDGPKTVVTWNDDESHHLFGSTGTTSAYAQDIAFRDFTVRGTGETRSMANAYPFLLYYVDGLRFEGITSEYSRVMGIAARTSTNVSAERNIVRYAKRDGINLAQCSGTSIRNNDLLHIDDDAISVSSSSADPQKVRTGDVVSGNRMADTQGIRALGARKLIVSGNQAARIRQHFVDVSTLPADGSSVQEGMSSATSVSITGNTFTDLIDRAYVDNLNQNANAILVNGVSARAGNYSVVPGEPDPATGLVRSPALETFANSTSTTVPTPGSTGISITGNTFAQTLPPSDGTDPRYVKFSDYGFGRIWTRSGWVDPALPAAAFRGRFLTLEGGIVRGVLAASNVVQGYGEGVRLDPGTRYDNIVVRGNLFSDISSTGVIVNTAGKLRAYVEENTFDMDPNLAHPNRGSGGTWQAGTVPTAIYQQQGSGLVVRRNTFRSMARVSTGPLSTPGYTYQDNTAEADLASTGAFSTANRGIGYVPEISDRLHYIQVAANPLLANFGTILSAPSDWMSYTPAVAAASGSFTTATADARYRISGGTLHLSAAVTLTTVGTGAGAVYLGVPPGITLRRPCQGIGREDAATGRVLQASVLVGGQSIGLLNYDNSPPIGDGYRLNVSISCEIQ